MSASVVMLLLNLCSEGMGILSAEISGSRDRQYEIEKMNMQAEINEKRSRAEFRNNVLTAAVEGASAILAAGTSILDRKMEASSNLMLSQTEKARITAEEEAYEKRQRFNIEMEELQKDRDLQRRKDVLQSIQSYQVQVTESVNKCMLIMAAMPVELHEKANRMAREEIEYYENMKQRWQEDAFIKLEKIEKMTVSEQIKERMQNSIWDGIEEMMGLATDTVRRIEQDVIKLNDNALELSRKGEEMVESYSQSMQLDGASYRQGKIMMK